MEHPQQGIPMYLDRRSWPEDRQWIPKVILWSPAYLKGYGDGSYVHMEDGGEFYLGCSASRVYQAVANYYGFDVAQMRRHYVAATRHSQSVPLPIVRRNAMLIPFKARCPECRNDGATGYIADRFIERVDKLSLADQDAPGIRIRLVTGMEVTAPMTVEAFAERRQRANYFRYYLAMNEMI
jgi:hypothetical protein